VKWLDENLPLVAIPYFALGLGIAFAPSLEASGDRGGQITAVDITFFVAGHLILGPAWWWLYKRYRRSPWRVRRFAYVLPAASYLLPAAAGLVAMIF
jgi:hypothetical protein